MIISSGGFWSQDELEFAEVERKSVAQTVILRIELTVQFIEEQLLGRSDVCLLMPTFELLEARILA